jgi:hypothetical protein
VIALLAAAVILFLGPAWEDILWPFQIAWLISVGTGIGALMLLDRRDRFGDVAACLLLVCSLASAGLGVAITLGAAVDVLAGRDRWRRVWVVAVPLAAYALWWLVYQDANDVRQALVYTPRFVVTLGSATISALAGLAGQSAPGNPAGTLLVFGPSLAAIGIIALVWCVRRRHRVSPRVLALLTIVLSFWVLVGLSRALLSQGYDSRYLYVGGVFILLLAVELARGVELSARAVVVVSMLGVVAIVSNLASFSDAGKYLRAQARAATADLGALDIGRQLVRPDYVATRFNGWPFVVVDAGSYFAAERDFGSPAATPAQIQADPEAAREIADSELIAIHGIELRGAVASHPIETPPAVDLALGGTVSSVAGCVSFTPSAYTPGSDNELQLTVPPGGLRISAEGGSATVAVRRFATQFRPVGTIARSAAAMLKISADRAQVPWHLRIVPSERATVCAMG